MRIRQIAVRNFRNLRDVKVRPRNPLILCGENNTGKTNLLYALRLLLGRDANRLALETSEEDINEGARSKGENWFTVTVEIGDLQLHQELEAVFRDRLGQDGSETFVTIQGEYRKQEDGGYEWQAVLLPPPGRANDPVQFTSRMARVIPLFYLDAVRDANVELRPTGRGLLATALGQVDLSDVEKDIMKSIREANAALGGNAGIKTLSEGITGLLNPNIPGGKGKVSMAVATEDPSQLMKGVRMNLQREAGGRAYDISRHGTGMQNMILIAMFRYLLHADPIAQPILAVEEPEAYLHVHAQRTLFGALAKIDSPIILTTHSPALVSAANPLSLVRLRPKGEGDVTAHQLAVDSMGNKDRSLLARMMRSGRSDALFARVILLVEGPSEVAAIPAFARHLGQDLDRDGVSLLPAEGNSFSYILRACDSDNFSIPAVVVFDADALGDSNDLLKEAYKAKLIGKDDVEKGRKTSDDERLRILGSTGWIAARPNFEEEVASAGYLETILGVIEQEELGGSLDDFLGENQEKRDPHGVAKFLRGTRGGRRIKVLVAQEIAEQVETVKKVPECYEKAITGASQLAIGQA